MATSSRDLSNFGGQPITLYRFARYSTPTLTGVQVHKEWLYTSADRDYTFNSEVYKAIAISDDGVRQTGNASADQLNITMPVGVEIPLMFRGSPPSDPIYAVVIRTHQGEADAYTAWNGIVGGISRNDDISCRAVCNTNSATLDRAGVRLAWSRHCPHDLYGSECKMIAALFDQPGVIESLDGIYVYSTAWLAFEDQFFAGGFVEWIDVDGMAERRGVISNNAGSIRVLGTTDRMTVGHVLHAFPGCGHTVTDCINKFNNLPNYGGHVYMPDDSPFTGDNIF